MGAKQNTVPTLSEDDDAHKGAHIIVAESYTAPDGSVYVHQDLCRVVEPWAVEQHISPIKAHESFGDVESWAEYVTRFASVEQFAPLLTWSERGLRAVLDYHGDDGTPRRCQWTAEHPFTLAPAWRKWAALATGSPRSQREVLEAFEDLGADILEPAAADLVALVRTLRATSMASADTELRPDGTTRVSYTKNQTVNAGELVLPPTLTIAVQALKGHVAGDENGKEVPVLYRLTVRMRVSVGDDARLSFRLSMPDAERVLEAVYADRVEAARVALGSDYSILRATA